MINSLVARPRARGTTRPFCNSLCKPCRPPESHVDVVSADYHWWLEGGAYVEADVGIE